MGLDVNGNVRERAMHHRHPGIVSESFPGIGDCADVNLRGDGQRGNRRVPRWVSLPLQVPRGVSRPELLNVGVKAQAGIEF